MLRAPFLYPAILVRIALLAVASLAVLVPVMTVQGLLGKACRLKHQAAAQAQHVADRFTAGHMGGKELMLAGVASAQWAGIDRGPLGIGEFVGIDRRRFARLLRQYVTPG
jgi:hypothetical protein